MFEAHALPYERFVVGIDPGFSGALAIYNQATKQLCTLTTMPLTPISVIATDTRRCVDATKLAHLLHPLCGEIDRVILERVNASPKMGVTSAFRFGEGFGTIVGVLGALGLRVSYAYPSVWKTALGLSSDKTKSTELAASLFPNYAATFRKGKNSADFAEAALLARYGDRHPK